jgi:hypothetical protein
MSTGYVVFLGVILLIVIYVYVYRKKFGIEGFISYTVDDPSAKAACAPKTLVQDPVQPEVAQLGVGSIPPSKAVGDIPSSSYTPRRAASMPYRNPGTEPSRYINILSALQQFQAFFGFEAPALESECSPTVVLPLETARADMSQLQTQTDVLERNPGIPSTITTKELAQMMSNLRYLQKAARKIKANSGTELLGANSYSGKVVETFVSSADEEEDIDEDEEGTEDTENTDGTPATGAQLTAFKMAIESALTQLRSGTANATDPITLARVAVLDRLRRDVEDIIIDLDKGNITASQVPVYYEDISGISNRLADTDKSIGTIIRNVSLPPVLAKLFPTDMNYKDKLTLSELSDDIRSYMDELTDGLSWKAKGDISLQMNYDSQRALDIANANATKGSVKAASADAVDNTDYASASTSTTGKDYEATNTYNASSTSYIYDRSSGASTEAYSDRPTGLNADGTRIILQDPVAGGFDWKGRAEHVCGQIKYRGMEPTAFGCVKAADVGSNYSWRGNVAMVCSRLKSTTDPGLPVSAGCPPASWDGWKS